MENKQYDKGAGKQNQVQAKGNRISAYEKKQKIAGNYKNKQYITVDNSYILLYTVCTGGSIYAYDYQ